MTSPVRSHPRPTRTQLLAEILRRAIAEHGPEWQVAIDPSTPPLIEVRVRAPGDAMVFEIDERLPEAELQRRISWAFEQFGERQDQLARGRLAPMEAES